MAKKSYRDLILVLIFRASGKWSWYQIERALDLRGIGGRINSVEIVNSLIDEGYIEEKKMNANPLSVYVATYKGEEKARQLVSTYGIEDFDANEKDPNDYI